MSERGWRGCASPFRAFLLYAFRSNEVWIRLTHRRFLLLSGGKRLLLDLSRIHRSHFPQESVQVVEER